DHFSYSVLLTVRSRASGNPGPRSLTERLGPRLRGDERRRGSAQEQGALIHPIQLSKSQASSPPALVGLGVCPSLFRPLKWGAWRAEKAHCPDFAGRPEFVFRAGPDRRTLTHMTRASALSRRATRHLRLYAFNGSVGPARSLSAAGGLPAAARGHGYVDHARGCRISPHLHDISRRCPSVDGTMPNLW